MGRTFEIVVAAIFVLIVLVNALPGRWKGRQVSNDSAAVANLRTINTAEVTYLSSSGGSYGEIAVQIGGGAVPRACKHSVTCRP